MFYSKSITTILLHEVASRLSGFGRVELADILASQERSENQKTLYDYIVADLAKTEEVPVLSSFLMKCVREIMIRLHCCLPSSTNVDQTWGIERNYRNQTHPFFYFGEIIEVSVLNEFTEGSSIQFLYLIINFRNRKNPCYHVERFMESSVPSFISVDKSGDRQRLRQLKMLFSKIWDRFCVQAIQKKNFKTKEFSMRGIHPIFRVDDSQPAKRKRKRTSSPTSCDVETFETFDSPQERFYYVLKEDHDNVKAEISESGRLFGIVVRLLTDFHDCTTTVDAKCWPCETEYENKTLQIFMPLKLLEVEVSDQKDTRHPFYIAVLKNDKELFLSVRNFFNDEEWSVKKVIKKLVPSFKETEKVLDLQRIHNLDLWLDAMITEFFFPVMIGSYQQLTLSKTSSCASSQNISREESPATSASVSRTEHNEDSSNIEVPAGID